MTELPMDRGGAWAPIEKARSGWELAPDLRDYGATRAVFSWEAAAHREVEGLPGENGLNLAYEAVDRRASSSRCGHLALR